jgi:hypothetical protein
LQQLPADAGIKEPGLTRLFFYIGHSRSSKILICHAATTLSPAGDANTSTQIVTDVASCPTQIDNIL